MHFLYYVVYNKKDEKKERKFLHYFLFLLILCSIHFLRELLINDLVETIPDYNTKNNNKTEGMRCYSSSSCYSYS